jgi:hypothetical protein
MVAAALRQGGKNGTEWCCRPLRSHRLRCREVAARVETRAAEQLRISVQERLATGSAAVQKCDSESNTTINVLNTLEEPISEEDYAKMMEEKEKNKVDKNMPMPEEERTMINQGGLAVAALPATVGALFMLWGLGGELGWF